MNSPGKCVAVKVLSLILPVRVVTCPSTDGGQGEVASRQGTSQVRRAQRVKAIRTVDVDCALWAGVELRTVQQWLGHSDMESTMRYLKPSHSQQVRKKVNEIFA